MVGIALRDYFPDKMQSSYTVFPSLKIKDKPIEGYNVILGINSLIEHADQTYVVHNEALYNMCYDLLNITKPKYNDLNWIVSCVMAGVTAPLRFSGFHAHFACTELCVCVCVSVCLCVFTLLIFGCLHKKKGGGKKHKNDTKVNQTVIFVK